MPNKRKAECRFLVKRIKRAIIVNANNLTRQQLIARFGTGAVAQIDKAARELGCKLQHSEYITAAEIAPHAQPWEDHAKWWPGQMKLIGMEKRHEDRKAREHWQAWERDADLEAPDLQDEIP